MKTNSSSNKRASNNATKIVVIGGSGLIGTMLVNNLRQQGHEVVAAGLAEALAGAQVVVDVANSPSWEDSVLTNSSDDSCAQPRIHAS